MQYTMVWHDVVVDAIAQVFGERIPLDDCEVVCTKGRQHVWIAHLRNGIAGCLSKSDAHGVVRLQHMLNKCAPRGCRVLAVTEVISAMMLRVRRQALNVG